MSATLGPPSLANSSNLVLYLDAANQSSYPGSGTTWTDLSGRGNHGTLVSGPTFSSANGGSIVFDGTNDYVTVANNSSLNATTQTINIWFKASSITSSPWLIGKADAVGSFNGYGINLSDGTPPAIGTFVKLTTGPFSGVSSSISVNTWYYATMSFSSGGTLSLYMNGILMQSTSSISFGVGSTDLRIGVSLDSFWTKFTGSVGLVTIYNRVLTATEVLQNYNSTKTRFGL